MRDYARRQTQSRANALRQAARRLRRLRRENRAFVTHLLEEEARTGAQEGIQAALEVERDAFLGRAPGERVPKKAFRGHRNGYSPRTVTLGCGPIDINMPRVRNNPEPFASQLLAPYQRTGQTVLDTLPDLYLYGVSGGDFHDALGVLFGEEAALSNSTITRLRQHWYARYLRWHAQALESHYAYVYADGVYVKTGSSGQSMALLVVIGVDQEGRKRLLAVLLGGREDYDAWLSVFRHLRTRGVQWMGLVIADGIAGLWRALSEVYPATIHQRDWVHKIRNVLNKLPQDKQLQRRALKDLQKIYCAETRADANRLFRRFAEKYADHPAAVHCLLESRKQLTAFYDYPREHWRHIRTSNAVESPFGPVRMRLRKAKRLVTEATAVGIVHQLLLQREARWHPLNYAGLAANVIAGTKYRDGIMIKRSLKRAS
jgi:transposase-like protein